MLQFRKNSLVALLTFGMFCATSEAVIVVDYAAISPPAIGFGNRHIEMSFKRTCQLFIPASVDVV